VGNLEEEGGFGVVNKQVQGATGRYRAVKPIDKRLHPKIHYSRELLMMAILAKVFSPPKEFTPSVVYRHKEYSCGCLTVSSFTARHYL